MNQSGGPRTLQVLVVTGPCGGGGRTTAALQIAACWGREGFRTLVADVSPSGAMEYALPIRQWPRRLSAADLDDPARFVRGVVDSGWPGLAVLPRRSGLIELMEQGHYPVLPRAWEAIAARYERVVVDAGGCAPPILWQVLAAASRALVVTACDPIAVRSLPSHLEFLGQVSSVRGEFLGCGLLVNAVADNDFSRTIYQFLEDEFISAPIVAGAPADGIAAVAAHARKPLYHAAPEARITSVFTELSRRLGDGGVTPAFLPANLDIPDLPEAYGGLSQRNLAAARELHAEITRLNERLETVVSSRDQIEAGYMQREAELLRELESLRAAPFSRSADAREDAARLREAFDEQWQQVNELQALFDDVSRRRDELEEQLRKSQLGETALRGRVEELESVLEHVRRRGKPITEITRAPVEGEAAAAAPSLMEQQLEGMRAALEKLREEKAALMASYNEITTQKRQAEQELEALRKDFANTADKLTEARSHILLVESQVANLESQLSEVDRAANEKRLQALQPELESLKARLREAQESENRMRAELNQLRGEMVSGAELPAAEDAMRPRTQLRPEKTRVHSTSSTLPAVRESQGLHGELESLQKSLREKEQEIAALQSELESLQKDHRELAREHVLIMEHKQRMSARVRELEESRDSGGASRVELEAARKLAGELEEKNRELAASVAMERQKKEELALALRDLQVSQGAADVELQGLRARVKTLTENLRALREGGQAKPSTGTVLTPDPARLQERIRDLEQERDALELRVKELTAEQGRNAKTIESLNVRLYEANLRISQLEEQSASQPAAGSGEASLREELVRLEEEKTELHTRLKDAIWKLEQALQRESAIQTDSLILGEQISVLEAQLAEARNQKLEAQDHEQASRAGKLSTEEMLGELRAELEASIRSQFESEKARWETRKQELKEELSIATERAAELQKMNDLLKSEIRDLRERSSAMETRLESAVVERAAIQFRLDEAEKRAAGIGGLVASGELEKAREEIASLKARVEELQAELNAIQEKEQSARAELEQRLKQLEADRVSLEGRAVSAEAASRALQERVRELEQERKDLAAQVETLASAPQVDVLAVQNLEIRIQTLEADLKDMEEARQRSAAEVERLRKQLKQRDGDIENLAQRLRSVENERDAATDKLSDALKEAERRSREGAQERAAELPAAT